jgi:CheY-like chemotaxis protein
MSGVSPKVLVIDEEPPIRKLLRMDLTTQGFRILEASTGKAALDLRKHRADLITVVPMSTRPCVPMVAGLNPGSWIAALAMMNRPSVNFR